MGDDQSFHDAVGRLVDGHIARLRDAGRTGAQPAAAE